MTDEEALERFNNASVATLATLGTGGAPRLVPCVFAVVDRTIVTAVDHKPKRTRQLGRINDIKTDERVALLTHHYADDWSVLWWVRIDGAAVVTAQPDRLLVDALVAKYHQYAESPPAGPWILISIRQVTHWSAS